MLPCEACGHYDEDAMDIDQEGSSNSGSLSSTSTHPSSVKPADYYSEFQEFWDQAKIALEGAYPSYTQPRNSRVGVLLLSFKDDDLGVSDELGSLKEIFESKYRYETETWLIPTIEPEEALSRRIYQFRRKFCQTNRNPNNPLPLLIVYYGGHSAEPLLGGNSCDWSSQSQGPCAQVNWTTIQPILFDALADVLVILDCCYGSSAAWRAGANNVGAKETLAASGPGSPASGVGEESFTSALISELKLQASKRPVLTAVGLQGRLLQAGHRLKFQPVYAPSHRTSRYSAALVPFPSSGTTQSGSGTVASPRSLNSPVRVLLSIHLRGDPTDELLGFLRNECALPISVTGMHIESIERLNGAEAIFGSTSTLVLVSVPVAAWHLLPDHGGCCFVAMITGPNLLAGGGRLKLRKAAGMLAGDDSKDRGPSPKRPSSVASDSGFESEGEEPAPPYPTTIIPRNQNPLDIYTIQDAYKWDPL